MNTIVNAEEAKSAILNLLAEARAVAAGPPASPLDVAALSPDAPMLRKRRWLKAFYYYQGFQRGYFESPDSLDWFYVDLDSLEPEEMALVLTRNVLRPFIKTILKEWVRSQPRLSVVPAIDSEDARSAARFAAKIVSLAQQKLLRESQKQVEGLNAILTGNYFRLLRITDGFDRDAISGLKIEVVNPIHVDLFPTAQSLYDSPFVILIKNLPRCEIARRWGAGFSDSASPFAEEEVVEAWFDVSTLPEELKAVAPDGLAIVECGGQVLELRNENKNDVWVHGKYDVAPSGPYGVGVEDALELQDLVNELQSLLVQNALHNSAPKLVYNPRLIDGETISNDPAEMIPLSPQATPDTPPEQAFAQIPPVQMSGEVGALFQSAYEGIREFIGAFPVMQGVGDARAKTATATAILRDASLALLGPALSIKSEVEADTAQKILRLVRRAQSPEAVRDVMGDYSELEARAFFSIDLDELEVTASQGSWFPRSDVEIRQDFLEYVGAGFLSPDVPDEVKEYALSLYNLPVQLDEFEPDRRVAALRLDKARELCAAIEANVHVFTLTPEIVSALAQDVAQRVEFEPDIDDHVKMAAYYIKWLKTDAGLKASPLVRETVKALIRRHAVSNAQLSNPLTTNAPNQLELQAAAREAGRPESAGPASASGSVLTSNNVPQPTERRPDQAEALTGKQRESLANNNIIEQ